MPTSKTPQDTAFAASWPDDPEPAEPQCAGDPLGHVWEGVTPLTLAKGDTHLCKGCGQPYPA